MTGCAGARFELGSQREEEWEVDLRVPFVLVCLSGGEVSWRRLGRRDSNQPGVSPMAATSASRARP